MDELQEKQKQEVSIFSNEESILRFEKAIEDVEEIKDILIDKKKEELIKEKKEQEELKLQEVEEKKEQEKLKKEEVKENKEQEELKLQEEESFNLLLNTISESGMTENIEYKEELLTLNNNLVDFFGGGVVFIGFAIGIVLSSLFMKGLYK